MKIYLLYILPNSKLYAISDNKEFIKRFLTERNPKLFKLVTKKCDKEVGLPFMSTNYKYQLDRIPLEDDNGDCELIGTIEEGSIINLVCEKMAETCTYLKNRLSNNDYFTDEFKSLLNDLTTISKDLNYHPIIQIDSIKLFYHLFKETFIHKDEITYDESDEILYSYRN
jgi:hypothetical protein